jgi:DNA-binding NarL/FixJ family response regulator
LTDTDARAAGIIHPARHSVADIEVKTYIVEDSPVILKNLVVALEELAPVQVVGTAADEAAALAWLRNPDNAADLVIIDIFLKSGSGLGVLRAMKSLGLGAKRVVLTNYATADMRQACLNLGADRVFDKSGEVEELLAYCSRVDGSGTTGPGAPG